jgi:YqaJ-like viral recombinase domain
MIIQQRTPEWYAARCGKPTASQAWRIMAVKKNGEPSSERVTYMIELLAERLTGTVADHYTTRDMQRGIDIEDEAIRAYEAETGLLTEPGYWIDIGTWGGTPDAFVDVDGLVSVKCPRSTTIVRQRYFDTETPPEYYWQAQAEMTLTNRKWCDLVRYDDRFTQPSDQLWIVRIDRNDGECASLQNEICRFLDELDAFVPGPASASPRGPGAGRDAPALSAPAGNSLLDDLAMSVLGMTEDDLKYGRSP